MKKLEAFFRRHKMLAKVLILSFFVLMFCFSFPMYNFTKDFDSSVSFTMLYSTIAFSWCLGEMETRIWPTETWFSITGRNLLLVLGGLLCRYLLEFGEVSNTYNFTLPNLVLHIPATVGIATLSWHLRHRKMKT